MINLLPDYALHNYITSYSLEERRQAHALWRANTARPGLIDSRQYQYDRTSLQYRDMSRGGRYIPDNQISMDVLRFSHGMRDEQRRLAQRAINQSITHQEWYDESLRLMKLSYHAAVDVANGDQQDNNNELLLLLLLLFFNRHNNMARQISEGEILLDASILGRVGLYGLNARSVYQNYRLENAKLSGYTECKRIPGPVEHCNNDIRPGCNELIALGWMPISKMVPIGQTTCLAHCQCSLKFRNRVLGIFTPPIINKSSSFVHVYDNNGKLLFKYSPANQQVEIKHKWHSSPVTVDLSRYEKK